MRHIGGIIHSFWEHRVIGCIIRPVPSLLLFFILLGSIAPAQVLAQHPIDVQKLSADGEHFKALTTYDLIPARRLTKEARIAAGKSAWALSLQTRAAAEFDAVLRESSLTTDTRARLTLFRGVIEFQEERFPEAALYAEKAASLLREPSPLRGRAYLLWGQALSKLKAYAAAEEKFNKAIGEADSTDRPELEYALGLVEVRLGKFSKAEEYLQAIPADHDRSPQAVRMLATIAVNTQQFDKAQFWLDRGREQFPDAFLDSWGDYASVQVALANGDLLKARNTVDDASKQFPPSDPWLLLMQAAVEQSEWERKTQVEAK